MNLVLALSLAQDRFLRSARNGHLATADDNGHLFRVVPSDAQQAVALVAVASAAGASKPAVLYMTNDYGAGLGDNFAANWSGDVCTQVGYDPAEGSYLSLIHISEPTRPY